MWTCEQFQSLKGDRIFSFYERPWYERNKILLFSCLIFSEFQHLLEESQFAIIFYLYRIYNDHV